MTLKELKSTIIVIIALALVCWAAWIIEIKWLIGWEGMKWLISDLYSPYFICLIVAIAYIFPFWIKYRAIDAKIVLTTLIFFMFNLTTYLLSEVVFKTLYTPAPLQISQIELFVIRFLHFSIFFLFALAYYFITDKLIMKIARQSLTIFMLCEVLMFILGIATNFIFRGWDSHYSLIDAIKMGYPQFWICILMGFAGIYIVQLYSEIDE